MFSRIWKKLSGKPRVFVHMTEKERYLKTKEVFLQIMDIDLRRIGAPQEVVAKCRKGLGEAAQMDEVTRNSYAENLKAARDLVELVIRTQIARFVADAVNYTFDHELLEAVSRLLHSDVFCDLPLWFDSSGQNVAGHGARRDWMGMFMSAQDKLETLDPKQAKIVNKIIEGMNSDAPTEETAKALGMPLVTVEREWRVAKAWLRLQLG